MRSLLMKRAQKTDVTIPMAKVIPNPFTGPVPSQIRMEAVINVDVTPDAEVHIHRIGRTTQTTFGRVAPEYWQSREKRPIVGLFQCLKTTSSWHNSAPSAPTPIQRHKAWPRLPFEKKFHVPYPYSTPRRAETRTSIDHTKGS